MATNSSGPAVNPAGWQQTGNVKMGWQKPWISVLARTLLGFPLAAVLGSIGMAVALALAVFFGVAGLLAQLAMLMIGAGVGAGIGAGLTMFRVDAIPPWPVWLAVGLGLAVVSTAAGWVGYQVGDHISAIEDANCVGVCGYLFKPRTYIAMGATLVPNVIALLFNIGYEGGFWRRTQSHHPSDDTMLGRSNEGETADGGARAPGKTSR